MSESEKPLSLKEIDAKNSEIVKDLQVKTAEEQRTAKEEDENALPRSEWDAAIGDDEDGWGIIGGDYIAAHDNAKDELREAVGAAKKFNDANLDDLHELANIEDKKRDLKAKLAELGERMDRLEDEIEHGYEREGGRDAEKEFDDANTEHQALQAQLDQLEKLADS